MRKFHYELVDVFTKEPFGGNQLAVFEDAAGLTDVEMQKITRELNLSEAVFVTKIIDQRATIRIFTPSREVPIAGHPTIGTGYVLARDEKIKTREGETSFIFDEQIGEIPLKIFKQSQKIKSVEMIQPIPEFMETYQDKDTVSALLSITPGDVSNDSPMQVVSAGVPFLFVPVNSLSAMKKIKFRQDVWEREFLDKGLKVDIFAFSSETIDTQATVHSRMFGPTMGISEDPATGAASGPLGAYLTRYKLVAPQTSGEYQILSEQGMEINRPSQITINVKYNDEKISFVSIAGPSADVGRGTIVLD